MQKKRKQKRTKSENRENNAAIMTMPNSRSESVSCRMDPLQELHKHNNTSGQSQTCVTNRIYISVCAEVI